MRDLAVFVLLVGSFATFLGMHVAIVSGLSLRRPRWRAPVALLCAPLAPYWALQENMRKRAIAWGVAFVVYAVARILAHL